jgi:cytochrome c oxidase subunit 1
MLLLLDSDKDGMKMNWKTLELYKRDRALLKAFISTGLVIMAVGGMFALLMVMARVPAFSALSANTYYQALTGHGIFMFILWFSFVQSTFLIAAGTALMKQKLWSYPLAWAGFGLMVLAAGFALVGVLSGASITYHGAIPLAEQYSTAWMIYLSFILLTVGMLFVVVDYILTVFKAVGRVFSLEAWSGFFRKIPIATFAAIAGLFIAVPGLIASLKTFLPALWWVLGWGDINPEMYRMNWHVAFHIYHYIPALTLVGVAYVLVELCADAQSIYSKRLAKGLFLLYPLFVPPTFLYHLLVDPNIPQNIKFVGTTLSLLVGTPTLLHMFIIFGMLEARFRSAGFGFLGWLGHLPWKNPAFASMMMGLATLFVGGLLSYIGLQASLSPMLHNTFAVSAYIHAIAAGGANLMYFGALFYAVPLLWKRPLWGIKLARVQSYLLGASLLWMSVFGVLAGLAGVMRRYASNDGLTESGTLMMNLALGVGGSLALLAMLMFLVVMLMTIFGKRTETENVFTGLMPSIPSPTSTFSRSPLALVPPLLFIVGIVLMTVFAFQWIRGLSIYGG